MAETPKHPDSALLDWMERYWQEHEDCPIGFDEGFFPYLTGSYPSGMNLRQSIAAAMEADREEREERYIAENRREYEEWMEEGLHPEWRCPPGE